MKMPTTAKPKFGPDLISFKDRSIAGPTITACPAPSRISCRETSARSHAPLRKTRSEHYDTIFPGSDRRHRRMVAIAAKVDGQALVGGQRDRRGPRHWRIVLACSDDRIGCVSCCRQLVVRALHQRLLHANAGGRLGAIARAEAAVVQHGCADLEQCRTAICAGCGTQGTETRRRRRPDCRRSLRLNLPGWAAPCVAAVERRRLLLGCQPRQRLLLSVHRFAWTALVGRPRGLGMDCRQGVARL